MSGTQTEDRVVRELDIYCCNGQLGDSTQLMLFQFPLRPPWRPYEVEEAEKVRIKPIAKQVQIEVPLDTGGPNYGSAANPAAAIQAVTLSSRSVEMGTSTAVGVLSGDRLLLAALDDAMQLRPNMAHLDSAREQERAKLKDKAAVEPEDDQQADKKPGGLQALTVKVNRRETDRQQEQRRNSYAYLSQQTEGEAWQDLHAWPSSSASAANIWDTLVQPIEQDVDMSMRRGEYLAALVPATASEPEPEASASASLLLTSPDGQAAGAAQRQQQESLSPEALAALPGALLQLFGQYSVCSLENIREFLTKYKDAGAASEARKVSDKALHEAIVGTGGFKCIRRVYVLAQTGSEQIDPFRSLLLGMLEGVESLKRSDILAAAKSAQVHVSDSLYGKVVKDLCTSRGNLWSLKQGT